MASIRSPFGAQLALATADDLDGTTDGTQERDLTGAAGAVILQLNSGTAGTAGIDVVEVSKDGGNTWTAAKIRNSAGTLVATGILNAAGVEPSGAALFTMHPRDGQMDGPTHVRVARAVANNAASVAWVTGAPAVAVVRIG